MPSVAFAIDTQTNDGATDAPSALLLVNKQELARRILKCSLPTLNDLIDRYRDDFPVVERGSHGIEWQFDAEAVVEFLQLKRGEEERAITQRAELLKQFSLPIDDVAPEDARGLSPASRRQLAAARLAERKLAIESGFLLQAAEVRQVVQVVLGRLGKSLDELPTQLGRRFNLPDEVTRSMRDMLDDTRRNVVAELREFLFQDSPDALGG